ncbi:MAG TPA: outer membrane protein assembly factor BamD [Rhabdochlamydiaceae bacterium]
MNALIALVLLAAPMTLSVQEHYSAALKAYETENWKELVLQADAVSKNFTTTPFAEEAQFFLGVGYFHLNEYEIANKQLSAYLKKQAAPKHFEEAMEIKFAIAEKYREGAKKHLLGWKTLPKWEPAQEEALALYDEVTTGLPNHEIAAQALFGKAQLLFAQQDYSEAVEVYLTLIRRFPKHELAPEAYIAIGEVHLTQAKMEYPNPDFLDLAELNLRKFRQDFPGDERVAKNEAMILEMKEVYASSLYETARFYERTKKPDASVIYYTKIMDKFPETKVAKRAEQRLSSIKK